MKTATKRVGALMKRMIIVGLLIFQVWACDQAAHEFKAKPIIFSKEEEDACLANQKDALQGAGMHEAGSISEVLDLLLATTSARFPICTEQLSSKSTL